MTPPTDALTLQFQPQAPRTYRVDLQGPQGETHTGTFILPYDPVTWTAILRSK